MSINNTLNNQLRTELINLICNYPPLVTRDGRDAWLLNLPSSVRALIIRRHDDCKIDIPFIINSVESQKLTDGKWPLLILIDALLAEEKIEELAIGQNFKALREKIKATYDHPISSDVISHFGSELDSPPSFEEIVIGKDEKVLVSFLKNGLKASKSVACIMVPRTIGGQGSGTGWMIAYDLLITCYHVVEARLKGQENPASLQEVEQQAKASLIWFGYDVGEYTQYQCTDVVHTNKTLDYAVLRIAHTSADNVPLTDWGTLKIVRLQPNLVQGTRLNVIQHPGGRVKEFALRSNFYIGSDAASDRLHYLSDTEKGSSGSPVLDDNWQVIGLHRAWDYYNRYYDGQPIHFSSLGLQYAEHGKFSGKTVASINEGVLIHSILDDLPETVRKEILIGQGWQ